MFKGQTKKGCSLDNFYFYQYSEGLWNTAGKHYGLTQNVSITDERGLQARLTCTVRVSVTCNHPKNHNLWYITRNFHAWHRLFLIVLTLTMKSFADKSYIVTKIGISPTTLAPSKLLETFSETLFDLISSEWTLGSSKNCVRGIFSKYINKLLII